MLHRRLGCWWWALLVVVLTTAMMETGAQKVEKEGLAYDRYNKEMPEPRNPKDSEGLKYLVTEEVYLDFLINSSAKTPPTKGRIVIACFGEIVPITSLNFVALAKGFKSQGKLLTYKNTPVHRVVRDFMIQMGDVTGGRGKSGLSIYGDQFRDENFVLSHRGAGWVSMANHGRNTNGSQFFILLQAARWLDGKHVAFGKVIKGMDILRKLGDIPLHPTNRPRGEVSIEDCGVMNIPSKYELTEKEVLSAEDLVA